MHCKHVRWASSTIQLFSTLFCLKKKYIYKKIDLQEINGLCPSFQLLFSTTSPAPPVQTETYFFTLSKCSPKGNSSHNMRLLGHILTDVQVKYFKIFLRSED